MNLCHARDRSELIHAVKTIEDSPIIMTHCGCQIRKVLPHVKPEWWGVGDDFEWCPGCTPAVEAELRRQGKSLNAPKQPSGVPGYKTTPDVRRQIVELRQRFTLYKTAEMMSLSISTIDRVMREEGATGFRKFTPLTIWRRAEIYEYRKSHTTTETARYFRVSKSVVVASCKIVEKLQKAGVK